MMNYQDDMYDTKELAHVLSSGSMAPASHAISANKLMSIANSFSLRFQS